MTDEKKVPDPERPVLRLDLQGEEGNIFVVVGFVAAKFIEESGETDGRKLYDAMFDRIADPKAHHNYQQALAIVNEYVRLVDTSGLYPEYATTPPVVWSDVKGVARSLGCRVGDDGFMVAFASKDGVTEAVFGKDDAPTGAGFLDAMAWLRAVLVEYSLIEPKEADELALRVGIDLGGKADRGDLTHQSLLQLISSSPYQRTAHNTFSGPCPKCGGVDRFQVRSDALDLRYYCRGCAWHGSLQA